MVSLDMGSGGSGAIDPSNMHLKKELTQIRKASRVLRDPGTSSSWRSPLNSARSLTKHHYVHHHKNGHFDGIAMISSSSEQFMQPQLRIEESSGHNNLSSGNAVSDRGHVDSKDKGKGVFLYNWRRQKSGSEKSRQVCDDYVENFKGDDESPSSNVDLDSLSDARNGGGNDSKSDTYLTDSASAIFNRKSLNFTPSLRRAVKKKSKRGNSSAAILKKHHKFQKEMLLRKCAENGLRKDFDDSEDSEDLRGSSAISPFIARMKNKGLVLRNHRRDNDSISCSTPAMSTSSCNNRYGVTNRSVTESWDASVNDADDEVDDQLDLPGRQGCGIPCYWSRRSTPKSRIGYGSSPSLSDTLRRKGSNILCGSGSQTACRRTHNRSTLVSKNRRQNNSRATAQGIVPLLTNQGGSSDDEAGNFGELDLEALSRLDGRRWSTSCRSQEEGLELVAFNKGDVLEESSPENARSLSHKHRPMFFDELVGQNLVVQSLATALSKNRIAPVYLFQGPRGTGKTSTARIFAAALNCLASEDAKPCGVCRECADFISGKSRHVKEVDGSNKMGIDKVKYLLKNINAACRSSGYKVFVVEECHLLPTKTWFTFLRLLEKPLPRVVFILTTTDIDNVPRAIFSRCQKHIFNKISNSDIVTRLRKIVGDESLDVESDAFELIASNADGSLRDAETMLDQLSLFGKRITITLVNELIGVVSEEKLLDLLELAMASNATETIVRARELMDSGVDPIVLMSQMAALIVDLIAGTYASVDSNHIDSSFLGGRTLSEREIERLKHALAVLSEAEKHLRKSSERSTWFITTLLHLGSPDHQSHSGNSHRQSFKATEDLDSPASFTVGANRGNRENRVLLDEAGSFDSNQSSSKILLNIWQQCIEKCHSKTLRTLLQSYGKLAELIETKGGFIAEVAFGNIDIKTRAEGFLSSITNSFELVLRCNVEVKISVAHNSMNNKYIAINPKNRSTSSNILGQECQTDVSQGKTNIGTSKEKKSGVPPQRIESIIRDQRLETAWLQAMEKNGTPGSLSRFKPAERNQVLPQDGVYHQNELELMNAFGDDELNHEIKALKINEGEVVVPQKDQIANGIGHYPASPSMLHNSSFSSTFAKDNMGYESSSGPGCSGLFCWNNTKPRIRAKVKQRTPIRANRSGHFSLFGECGRARTKDRYRQ